MATQIDKWLKWEECNFNWEDATGDSPYLTHTGNQNYTWEQVFLVTEIVEGGGGVVIPQLEALPIEKKKQCIKLIMHRNGIKVYDEKKCIENIKAYANEIKLIAEEIRSQITVEI